MSGGVYDYVFSRIDDAAREVAIRYNTPLRRAFAKHLHLVAEAMKAVEWVDSGDCHDGDEDDAIHACLAPGAEVEAAKEELQRVMVEATKLLARLP